MELKQSSKKKNISQDSLRNLWGNYKQNNIHIIGVSEEEEREKEAENLFENFPNLWKETDNQIQEA